MSLYLYNTKFVHCNIVNNSKLIGNDLHVIVQKYNLELVQEVIHAHVEILCNCKITYEENSH